MRISTTIRALTLIGMGMTTGLGCGGTCDTICTDAIECEGDAMAAYFEIIDSGTGGLDGCSWDDPEDIEERCVEACEAEYDKLSSSEAESVDACMECIEAEAADSCNDLLDAADDGCDNECDDEDDVEDFFGEMVDEWDIDESDIDC